MELGSIPGLGRCPGEGKGYPLQYSGLENSMDCIVHGITKIWIWQSDFHFHFQSCNNDSSTEFIDSWSLNTINVESYKKLNLREHTFCKVVIAQIHLGFSSLQFSCSVMSNSLWPHELWHTSLPCPLPTPGACSNSCTWMVMLSNHLILCSPVLLLPSIFCSIKIFSNESILPNRWLKYWNFKFNIRHSSEYSELISFRINLKSLLMKMKEESEKAGLKLNIQKLWSWHLVPWLHGK